MKAIMRLPIVVLLLVVGLQGPVSADVISLLPPDDAAVLKRCPAALADLDQVAAISEAQQQASAIASRADARAACQALRALADNGEKTVSDLRACQAQGMINAQALIQRMAKSAAEARSTAAETDSMQKACGLQR
ncbi:MAG: hypothetical protein ACRYGP_29240 [Janthinobacterium lividum]